MKWLLLNSILFILCTICSAQKTGIELIVEPTEVSVNQTIIITLKYNKDGNIIEKLPSNFIKGYDIQSFSQFVMDNRTGKIEQEFVDQFSGAFTKPGNYKIGPYILRSGNKSYHTKTILVKVTNGPIPSTEDFSRDQLKSQAFGIIERSAEKIYEGEPLILTARAYSKDRTVASPVLRRPYQVNRVVDMHQLMVSESWEELTVKGKKFQSISFERKLMFPTGSGFLEIKPYELFLPFARSNEIIQSNVPRIEVIPLPGNAPKSFIGAVGKFDVSQTVETKKLKEGDVFSLDVVVSGSGNLHNIEKPRLNLSHGMVIYGDPTITEDYIFTTKGAEGKVTFSFNIQVTKEGNQGINPVTISYFDPEKEVYITISADSSTTLHVENNPKFANNVDNPEAETMMKDELAPIAKNSSSYFSNQFYGSTTFWISLASPITLSLLFLLFLRRKEENKQVTKEKELQKSTSHSSKTFLQEAKCAIQEQNIDKFYSSFERALNQLCIGLAKLDPSVVYARQELFMRLEANGIESRQLIEIKDLFDKCDIARFGIPGSSAEQLELVSKIEQLTKDFKA